MKLSETELFKAIIGENNNLKALLKENNDIRDYDIELDKQFSNQADDLRSNELNE
jgi:hypothetical protein